MRVKRLTETAILPTRAHSGDLGYDLYADEGIKITDGQVVRIQTGIAIEFPEHIGGLILGRSSLATYGLTPIGGVIDSGYRGEIIVVMAHVKVGYQNYIGRGQKIAQLVLVPIFDYVIEETTEPFLQTVRGEKGFGSTGA